MTKPEGEKFCGLWEISSVEEPSRLVFRDYFADEDFNAVESMPGSTNTYTFAEVAAGTRVTYESTFESLDGLKTVLEMGVVEGSTGAITRSTSCWPAPDAKPIGRGWHRTRCVNGW